MRIIVDMPTPHPELMGGPAAGERRALVCPGLQLEAYAHPVYPTGLISAPVDQKGQTKRM